MSQHESFHDTAKRIILKEADLGPIVRNVQQVCKDLDAQDSLEVAMAALNSAARKAPEAIRTKIYKIMRTVDRLQDDF